MSFAMLRLGRFSCRWQSSHVTRSFWHSTAQRSQMLPVMTDIKLQCTEINDQGIATKSAGVFRKSDLCQRHSLLPRDLRGLDIRFPHQKPTILVRPEAILVNVAHLKALIKSDLVVLFEAYGSSDSYNQSAIIQDLQERLQSHRDDLPFEFRALEALLVSITSSLHSEWEVLEAPVTKLLNELEDVGDVEQSVNHSHLRDMLQFSKKLSKFEKDALSIRDAISELLDQDEDLAAMYLTEKRHGRPRDTSDHEEVELLLEAYLTQTVEVVNKVSTLISHMRSTEEIIQITLDVSRNAIMWFDIRLTIITLSASLVSVYGALFGMNLKNYFEDDPIAFGIMSGAALTTGLGAYLLWLRKLKMMTRIKQRIPNQRRWFRH